ncbi:MAG: hypothetical protein K9L56_14180 [Clostridiales bacterium]|nr:hypothetical protein [Clostridiales bacterium]
MDRYRCTNKCYFDSVLWKPGDEAEFDENRDVPHHFEKIDAESDEKEAKTPLEDKNPKELLKDELIEYAKKVLDLKVNNSMSKDAIMKIVLKKEEKHADGEE